MSYCASRFATIRRPATEVMIGAVGIGGTHPIRVQSMTTSDTQDVAATLKQCIELAEVGCEKAATPGNAKAQELGRDVCMHIAASNPLSLDRAGIPAEMVESEKAIYAKQVEGKPAAVVEKILAGKLDKFYQQNVLTEQAFVKDQDKSIGAVLDETGKLLGDKLIIRRYVRLQIGA